MISRLINHLRCWGSFALSIAGVSYVRHMPAFVSVEPADFCQLTCPECPVGLRRGKARGAVMGLEDFRHIVAEVKPYVHTMQLFWQGEPLLNDRLPEMVRIAREAGIYTIVSTNAQRLDQPMAEALVRAGLNRIIVSMDGWTQPTYEQYRRGGSVDKCKQAIRYLRQAKHLHPLTLSPFHPFTLSPFHPFTPSPLIELQCLYLKTNEAEWATFRREYKRLGADRLTMKTAQLYDYQQGSPLMPADARYARYRWNAHTGQYELRRRLHNRCYRLWSGCVIDVQGNVLPCCYDKQKQHLFGNIHRQSLRDIWHGAEAQRFRREILRHRKQISICTNCDE